MTENQPNTLDEIVRYLRVANAHTWMAFEVSSDDRPLFHARLNAAVSAYAAAVILDRLHMLAPDAAALVIRNLHDDGEFGNLGFLSAEMATSLGADVSSWMEDAVKHHTERAAPARGNVPAADGEARS